MDYTDIAKEEINTLLGYECEDVDKQILMNTVSVEEIRTTLFGMANYKSLEPDEKDAVS